MFTRLIDPVAFVAARKLAVPLAVFGLLSFAELRADPPTVSMVTPEARSVVSPPQFLCSGLVSADADEVWVSLYTGPNLQTVTLFGPALLMDGDWELWISTGGIPAGTVVGVAAQAVRYEGPGAVYSTDVTYRTVTIGQRGK
jgi:hypothetical protein